MNNTPETGWGSHQPGEKVLKLQEMEVGGIYLKRSTLQLADMYAECYNVVEILPLPDGWKPHKEDDVRYGRFVDPQDPKKDRIYSTGLFAIWDWELENRIPDLEDYYHINPQYV